MNTHGDGELVEQRGHIGMIFANGFFEFLCCALHICDTEISGHALDGVREALGKLAISGVERPGYLESYVGLLRRELR